MGGYHDIKGNSTFGGCLTYFTEFIAMLAGCLGFYLWDAPLGFLGSGLLGALLALLSAFGAIQFGKSIRATYRRGPLFYLTCLLVGVITLVSVTMYRALQYMRPVAEKSIAFWGGQVRANADLQQDAFVKAMTL